MEPTEAAQSLGSVMEREAVADVTNYQVTSFMGPMMRRFTGRHRHKGPPVSSIANALKIAARKAEVSEAERICGRASQLLAGSIERQTNAEAHKILSSCLLDVSSCLQSTEKSSLCGRASTASWPRMEQDSDTERRNILAESLVTLATGLHPNQKTSIFGRAARAFGAALDGETPGSSPI